MNTTNDLLFPIVRVFGNTTANWTHDENETSSEGTNFLTTEMESLVSKAFKVLAYAVAIILSLVGNSLTIGSVYQNSSRRMRTVNNYLIVNLCFADLLITVCNMPRMISIVLVGFEWPIGGTFGLLLCKINSSVPFVSLLVSTLTFTFIALDRFLAVVFPLRRPMTKRVVAVIMTVTWILPCCCYYLLFRYSDLIEIQGKTYCANFLIRDLLKTMDNYRTYLICDFIFVTGIPITTTTALYTAIGVKMYTRENPGIQTASSTARNRTVNRKVIAMLVTVEIVFCICWFPSWLALVCINPQPLQTICNSPTFHFVRYFMSYSNSAITPYIYPIFNQNFRAGYVQIVNQVLNFCRGRMCPRVATNQVFPLQERTTTHFRRGMRTLNTTRI